MENYYFQNSTERFNSDTYTYNIKGKNYSDKDDFSHNNKYETDKAQLEAEELIKNFKENSITKNNLMFQKQSISLFRIYAHLFKPLDWLFLILAIIGGIGAGVCQPAIFYLNSEIFSSIGNTSEQTISGPPQIVEMILQIRKNSIHNSMNNNVRKQLIFGAISFVSNFLSGTFWLLIGSRCIYNLKKKYFTVLLAQEQGWFDSFNTYELATKVQAQLEQIEMGIGIKVGFVLSSVIQLIMGFVFGFISCWKCTLVMLSVTPVVVIVYIILNNILRKGIILSRKIWENAGGIA